MGRFNIFIKALALVFVFSNGILTSQNLSKLTSTQQVFFCKQLQSNLDANINNQELRINRDFRTQLIEIDSSFRRKLRVNYHTDSSKTAWLLNSIGRSENISALFIVEQAKIVLAKVIAYRESIGWEIKHEGFLRQWNGVALKQTSMNKNPELDRSVANISGATLSVNAMKRMAKSALLLHQATRQLEVKGHKVRKIPMQC